ncbi:MAG: threonine aldolase family protein [Gaiellaceae bacterium]
MIDLRSDTFTKPTPGMLAAMATAEVGDEQYLEDPTTQALERRMAELLGQEAALFLPTATMANQAALRAQTKPGGVLLAEERTHVLVYEWGGPAIHSGLIMRGVPAERGRVTPQHVWAENDPDLGPGGIVVLENSHRSSGGTIWPLDEFRAGVDAARERGAAVHLDGARLFNAAVGAGVEPKTWSALADSVTICFSKGLGCPLGAVLAGSAALIERAWQSKYLFGGALRQSGVIAAAMLYALDHNVDLLADDHARARRLANGIGAEPPETNFVSIPDAPGLEDRLRERGVLVGNLRPGWLRAVTHLDIGEEDIDVAIGAMQEVLHVHA